MSGASTGPAPSWRPSGSRTRIGKPGRRRAEQQAGYLRARRRTARHGDVGPPARVDHPSGVVRGADHWSPSYHWTPSCWQRAGRGAGRSPRAYNLIPCHLIRADTVTVEQGCRTAARSSARLVAGTAAPRTVAKNRCPFGAVQGDADRQPLARPRQAHLVLAVDRVERGDVELLVDPRPALVVGEQQVGVPLVVGVVHLRDHAGERAVGPMAPEQGQRVERVPEHPGVRQHQHLAAAEVDPAAAQELVDVGPDAAVGIAEVIARVEAGQQRRPPVRPRQLVHVDQPLVAAVGERVAQRRHPGVRDPALVQHRPLGQRPPPVSPLRPVNPLSPVSLLRPHRRPGHQQPPSARAAAAPARHPSSWNPHPW